MASCTSSTDSLAYTEPELTLILTIGGFIVLLNVVGSVLDKTIHCGLIGQLILGALLGSPLAALFPTYLEQSIQVLGYLGLLLLLAEGGMDARLDILFAPFTFFLSFLVGTTGIILPIGLSMALLPKGFGYSYLQSFSVGAALSSTSLGTILALLSSVNTSSRNQVEERKIHPEGNTAETPSDSKSDSLHSEGAGLISTKLGSVLVGAALADDIVALVLSSVVSNLGPSQINGIKPWTAARPVVSSLLLLLITAAVGRVIIRPVIRAAVKQGWYTKLENARSLKNLSDGTIRATATILWVVVVGIYVTIAHEIGSTMLLGSFCAGALMKYSHGIFLQALQEEFVSPSRYAVNLSPFVAYGAIKPIQDTILVPFFFSSIGSSIPLKAMFKGRTVWKGFVFAGLCAFGKLIAGFWLMIADHCGPKKSGSDEKGGSAAEISGSREAGVEDGMQRQSTSHQEQNSLSLQNQDLTSTPNPRETHQASQKPRSWAPSMLLGLSLVARGEIGFIILNIARASNIIGDCSDGSGAEAFEVGVWSIVLNTLGGPIAVGILLRSKGLTEEIMGGTWGRA